MCIPPVHHSPKVYNLLKEASDNCLIHHKCVVSKMEQGYTDAEPFSRYGVKASNISGLMLDGFPSTWHVDEDTPKIWMLSVFVMRWKYA